MYMYKYIFTILKLSGTLRTFLYIDGQNDRKHPSTTINFYYFQSNHASNGDIENEIDDDENNQDVTSIVGKNDTKYIQENITIPLPSFIIIGTQKGVSYLLPICHFHFLLVPPLTYTTNSNASFLDLDHSIREPMHYKNTCKSTLVLMQVTRRSLISSTGIVNYVVTVSFVK